MVHEAVLLCLLVPIVSAAYYEEMYERVKGHVSKMRTKMTWEVGLNERFKGMSKEQLFRMAGAKHVDKSRLPVVKNGPGINLPVSFDARKQWPDCKSMSLIRDQAHCGSCWAVSSASVMSDRVCLESGGEDQPYISDEYLLDCCKRCGWGCEGGYPTRAFRFWKYGIPTGGIYGSKTGCQPYSIFCDNCREHAKTPKCSTQCIKEYGKRLKDDLYYGGGPYRLATMEDAMREIYEYGPITACFDIYEDVMLYKSGVYQHVSGAFGGGHAVRVIGWGVEKGLDYWLITNSWNTTYGEEGIIKIRRGVNEVKIEEELVAGKSRGRTPPS